MNLNFFRSVSSALGTFIVLLLACTLFALPLCPGAQAQVVLNISIGNPRADTSLKITWNKMDDADHYEVSVRDLTTNDLLYDHERTTSRSFIIDGDYLIANHSYRVWVGAYRPEDTEGFPPESHTRQREFTVPDDVCRHEGTPRNVVHSIYCVSVSDTQHRAETEYSLICPDCDEVLTDHQTKTETENHFFDKNGDCQLCNYRASCSHSDYKPVKENSYYTIKDASSHSYAETGHYVCSNAGCGKVLQPYSVKKTEAHAFKNGVCRYCGYKKDAPLTVSVSRGQQASRVGERISATATVSGGSGAYLFAWEVLCDGAVYTNTDYGYSSDYSYAGKCAGAWQFKVYVQDSETGKTVSAVSATITVTEAECSHSLITENITDTRYVKISDTRHEIRVYYNTVCADCAKLLFEGNYKSKGVEYHTAGSSGRCVCGYLVPTEACTHSASKPVEIDSFVEPYNEKWHRKITVYQDVCANSRCAAVLNANRRETQTVLHSYDANGKCVCGYLLPSDCDHAPLRTLVGTQYVVASDYEHKVIKKYHSVCACGQADFYTTEETLLPHRFENHVCTQCGHYLSCDHSATLETLSSEVIDDKNSDTTHLVVSVIHEYCACGQVDREYTQTDTVSCVLVPNAGVQSLHEENGHQYFDRCACGTAVTNGRYIDYLNTCAICTHAEDSQMLLRLQTLLTERGYSVGEIDGLWGPKTKYAMNKFRAEVMDLPPISYVDMATLNALMKPAECNHKHTNQYTSTHPHKPICDLCGVEMEVNSNKSIVLSYCPECFSKDTYYPERALAMGQLAEWSYHTTLDGCYTNEIYISDNYRSEATTEGYIGTSLTDDGELILTIVFQGSQENLWDDWLSKDFSTSLNEEGIRAGIYFGLERFIDLYINESTYINMDLDGWNGAYSTAYLIQYIKEHPNANIRITGHSLGGSYAQCMTHYLINESGIPAEQIETYTYAALIPFSNEFIANHPELKEANVYNFIHVQDYAPDVGPTQNGSQNEVAQLLLYAPLGSLIDTFAVTYKTSTAELGGNSVYGSNIGTNIHMQSLMDKSPLNIANTHSMKTYLDLLYLFDDSDNNQYDMIEIENFSYVRNVAEHAFDNLLNDISFDYRLVYKKDNKWYMGDISSLNYDHFDMYMNWDSVEDLYDAECIALWKKDETPMPYLTGGDTIAPHINSVGEQVTPVEKELLFKDDLSNRIQAVNDFYHSFDYLWDAIPY